MDKYYELFGRKHNVDFKKERNTTSEVDASQEQFDVIINETKKYLEIALKECETKFGKKGRFKIDVEFDNRNKEENNDAGDTGAGKSSNEGKQDNRQSASEDR